jgi:hypothetical protein
MAAADRQVRLMANMGPSIRGRLDVLCGVRPDRVTWFALIR